MVHPKLIDAALGGIKVCLKRLAVLVKRKLIAAKPQKKGVITVE